MLMTAVVYFTDSLGNISDLNVFVAHAQYIKPLSKNQQMLVPNFCSMSASVH